MILTGEYGAEVLEPLLPALARGGAARSVDVLPVANRFFGGNIAVTGLLTGRDVAACSRTRPATLATCSPTSCSPTAASSTASPSPTFPARSRSSPTDGASLVDALR